MKTFKYLFLLLALSLFISFPPPTNAATTLFSDDFEDGNYNGWSTYDGTWSVSGGALNVNSGPGYKIVASGQSFTQFVYEADLKVTNDGEAGLIFRVSNPGSGADAFNGYYFAINAGADIAVLGKMNGTWSQIAIKNLPINNNARYHLKVIANGTNIICYVNDNPLNTAPYPKFDVTDGSKDLITMFTLITSWLLPGIG
jgi:hypothetical protein